MQEEYRGVKSGRGILYGRLESFFMFIKPSMWKKNLLIEKPGRTPGGVGGGCLEPLSNLTSSLLLS